MKITYGSITLCGEQESPKNFSAVLRKRVQSDDIINAQRSLVSDRGNEKYAISFGIERAHKNPHDAECALFDIMREISEASPARLEICFEKSKAQKRLVFENAVLGKCAASSEGRITTHSFEFSAARKES